MLRSGLDVITARISGSLPQPAREKPKTNKKNDGFSEMLEEEMKKLMEGQDEAKIQ